MSIPVHCGSVMDERASLAGLRQLVLASGLPDRRRRAIAASLNSVGRALGRPLEALPTEPARLRTLLAGVTPAMAGLSPGSWSNVVSDLGAALSLLYPDMLPRGFDFDPSPEWADHLSRARLRKQETFFLQRFARYATRLGIAPDEVSDAVLERYRLDLTRRSLISEPNRCARETARAWNAVGARDPEWPTLRLAVPDNRIRYSLPWSSYPASLREEVDRWLDQLGRDPFARRKVRALRPATIMAREQQLALFLGTLVADGEDAAQMTCLAAVVTPANAERVVRFVHGRNGNRITAHLAQLAHVAQMIARHWLRLDGQQVEALRDLARNCREPRDGLAPSVTRRLGQLNDPARLTAVLTLPNQIEVRVRRAGPPTVHTARLMQAATAIEILLKTGLRLGNLADLEIGKSLLLRRDGRLDIVIDAGRVKNRVAFSAELSGASAALIRRYIADFRPLLGDPASTWLFPGQKPGTAKSLDGLRQQIKRVMADIAGVDWHPHAFRHLIAKVTLDAHPGSDGLITRVLGHRRSDTARLNYSGLATAGAIRQYDELLTQRRSGVASKSRAGR